MFIKKEVNKELDYNHAGDFYTLMLYNSKKKKLPKIKANMSSVCLCILQIKFFNLSAALALVMIRAGCSAGTTSQKASL